MRNMYFQVKAKSKKKTSPKIRGILLIAAGILLAYCVVVPVSTGMLGQTMVGIQLIESTLETCDKI